MLRKFVLLAALLACGAALADEASVRKLVEAKLGNKVQSVTRTPYGGLYEVYVDKNLHYTDEKVSFIIYGVLIDTKTDSNITEQRIRKLTALNVAQLPPLSQAIKGRAERIIGDDKRGVLLEGTKCVLPCTDRGDALGQPRLQIRHRLFSGSLIGAGSCQSLAVLHCGREWRG